MKIAITNKETGKLIQFIPYVEDIMICNDEMKVTYRDYSKKGAFSTSYDLENVDFGSKLLTLNKEEFIRIL